MGVKWKEDLNTITDMFRFEPADYYTLREIEKLFRVEHDGPYRMMWSDDNCTNGAANAGVMLQFFNDADATWWMWKNV